MSKQIVVKYKSGKNSFELICKPGSIEPFRQGKGNLDSVLLSEEIYANASKFNKANSNDLKKAFGSDDPNQCIQHILMNGVFPLTKKELNDKVNQKRLEILNYLHKYYHDPTKETTMPHPMSRFEVVLKDMKVVIDPYAPVSQQLKPIVKKLPEFIPVKPIEAPDLYTPQVDATKKTNTSNKNKSKKCGRRR